MKHFGLYGEDSALNGDDLKIAVIVPTYNHAAFIGRCITSVLDQDFEGPRALFVVDDCSTDDTAVEIEKAVTAHDGTSGWKIHYVHTQRNHRQAGIPSALRLLTNRLKSEYIAICEGDDAWRDRSKLRKQYAFLADNPDYAACGHETIIVDENGMQIAEAKLPAAFRRDFDRFELMTCNCWLLQNTIFFRGTVEIPLTVGNVANGDNLLWSSIGQVGKFKFLDDIEPSLYTRHSGGVWSQKPGLERLLMQADTWLRLSRYYLALGEQKVGATLLLKSRNLLQQL